MIDITPAAAKAGAYELEEGLEEGAHPVEIAVVVFIVMATKIFGKETAFTFCGERISTLEEIERDMEIEEAGGLQ
jgi:hypothetical protein